MVFFEPSIDFGTILEKLAPYLGAGFGGVILREIAVKFLNRKTDKTQNDKTNAETTAVLNKELMAMLEKLQKATELVATLQAAAVEKDRQHLSEKSALQDQIEEMQDAAVEHLARIAESSLISERQTAAYRRLTEKLDLPYWEADKSGKTIFINDCWLKMFRVTMETQGNWIEAVVQADRMKIIDEWKKRLIDQDSTGAIAFRVMGIEGEAIDVRSVYTIVRDASGEPLKIIGVTVKV